MEPQTGTKVSDAEAPSDQVVPQTEPQAATQVSDDQVGAQEKTTEAPKKKKVRRAMCLCGSKPKVLEDVEDPVAQEQIAVSDQVAPQAEPQAAAAVSDDQVGTQEKATETPKED